MSTLLPAFLLLASVAWATNPDSLVVIRGIVLDTDSLPVENAHLISYTTLLAYKTNEKGEFKITTPKSDSLKIMHISYDPVIVKPNDSVRFHTIVLNMASYNLDIVDIRLHDREIESMNKTFDEMRSVLGKEYNYNYLKVGVKNQYAPPNGPSGLLEMNFVELYVRLKRKYGK